VDNESRSRMHLSCPDLAAARMRRREAQPRPPSGDFASWVRAKSTTRLAESGARR
jgi:hypothetical protein